MFIMAFVGVVRGLWGSRKDPLFQKTPFSEPDLLGHTPRGSYSRKGVLLPSRRLLESPFLEPLLRTLLRTLLPIKSPLQDTF